MGITSCEEHYDKLIDENNDPVYDEFALREYMNKWDGDVFIEKLGLTGKEEILEIGIGTGRVAIKVVDKCSHLTGIDISRKTIEKAKINLKAFSNIELICDDFYNFSFSHKFDIIYSTLTFLHLKDKEKAILKISKLLNEHGKFVLSIDKSQELFLNYGSRQVRTYPDSLNQTIEYIKNVGLNVESSIETEFAYIITATNANNIAFNLIAISELKVKDLAVLSILFDYNDVQEMLHENAKLLNNQEIDIFGLHYDGQIIGELRVRYNDNDTRFAALHKRAYLYAFRILDYYQGKGLGNHLLQGVLQILSDKGYFEFTVGVENDNEKAKHLYAKFGFNEKIATINEVYQGDKYTFDLMLKR